MVMSSRNLLPNAGDAMSLKVAADCFACLAERQPARCAAGYSFAASPNIFPTTAFCGAVEARAASRCAMGHTRKNLFAHLRGQFSRVVEPYLWMASKSHRTGLRIGNNQIVGRRYAQGVLTALCAAQQRRLSSRLRHKPRNVTKRRSGTYLACSTC
jgi:hypothetical protein